MRLAAPPRRINNHHNRHNCDNQHQTRRKGKVLLARDGVESLGDHPITCKPSCSNLADKDTRVMHHPRVEHTY